MVDFGGISNTIFNWFGTGMFWVIVIVFLVGVGVLVLYINKRRNLKVPIWEIIEIGDNRIKIFKTRGGWFGKKTAVFGLFDYGTEKVFKTKEGKLIEKYNTNYMIEYGKERVLVCARKKDDPKILFPVPYFKYSDKSKTLMLAVASADYRDQAVNIVRNAINETKGTFAELLPYLSLGAVVLFFIFAVIFASQTFNKSIDTAKDLVLEATKLVASMQQNTQTLPSVAP